MFCHRRKLECMYADAGMWCLRPMRLVDERDLVFKVAIFS
jgi:hypothetical protein